MKEDGRICKNTHWGDYIDLFYIHLGFLYYDEAWMAFVYIEFLGKQK